MVVPLQGALGPAWAQHCDLGHLTSGPCAADPETPAGRPFESLSPPSLWQLAGPVLRQDLFM